MLLGVEKYIVWFQGVVKVLKITANQSSRFKTRKFSPSRELAHGFVHRFWGAFHACAGLQSVAAHGAES
jgi:hypothetical protein